MKSRINREHLVDLLISEFPLMDVKAQKTATGKMATQKPSPSI
jgi:hypothetical protein